MDADGRARVLWVDDNPRVMESVAQALQRHFAITTTTSGETALQLLETDGPFAVLVGDLCLPGIFNTTLFVRAREIAPDTVRVMLTGQADVHAARAAVNEAEVFRLLPKPCAPEALFLALQAAAGRYRARLAEYARLEQLLEGSLRALAELQAFTHPELHARATRAREHLRFLTAGRPPRERWETETAALLSQLGYVTLPPALLAKLQEGHALREDEQAAVDSAPLAAAQRLAAIPGTEALRHVIAYQAKLYDGRGVPRDNVRGKGIPWGARALKIALNFDDLVASGLTSVAAIDAMQSRERRGHYDPEILAAFAETAFSPEQNDAVQEIPLAKLEPGMVVVTDVRTRSGALLIPAGQQVTAQHAARLRAIGAADEELVCVLLPRARFAAPVTAVLAR
ncbi:MAG TPA: HD domain-containing phosphohydrolase [Chloroflexota bacterium]|nr:HD domain-containing phosphohydrolase [Chloroflexota bacterium]